LAFAPALPSMWRVPAHAAPAILAPVWFEGLGEWSWPGIADAAPAADVAPPPWVPAFPPARRAAVAPRERAASASARSAHRTLPAILLVAVVALVATLALKGRLPLAQPSRSSAATHAADAARAARATAAQKFSLRALPTLQLVSRDEAGSAIEHAGFSSVSVHGQGGFLVYLPPGYRSSRRYPVLYLLHGNEQLAVEFLLQGDLQGALDQLIKSGRVPSMIAVMPEGGRGAINWRNLGAAHWESYVVEVQELVDRMLPTIRERDARAIAGDSMGAYGAMNVALGNPYRFGIVESWLGFFNGLEGQLRIDRPVIEKLGLDAFVYGAQEDHIANPDEDAPFAAALRANGATASSAVYPGEHNMQTVQEHLESQLILVGNAFEKHERLRADGRGDSAQ
jgi:enterochelin esterase-like enzyme